MTDALRVELRRAGIRVSLIEPGMTYSAADKPRFSKSLNTDFERALRAIPEENQTYYRAAMERARDFNRSMLARAAPPERVARSIRHALTSRRPKPRYWCGVDGKLAGVVGLFAPAAAKDAFWRRTTGL